MPYRASLAEHFPGALPAWAFLARSMEQLADHGFERGNTIACVGTCRDELCVPLRRAVQDAWGEAFNFSSLAGMLLLGTSGFRAAHAHAPLEGGRERYLYVAMPHIGIADDGTLGVAYRLGQEGTSAICGALSRILGEVAAGALPVEDDPDDPELSLVRRKLAPHLTPGAPPPSLLELTRLCLRIIEQDLDHFIDLTVDTTQADFAVLTGIQIHVPRGHTYVQPSHAYVRVRGERHELADE